MPSTFFRRAVTSAPLRSLSSRQRVARSAQSARRRCIVFEGSHQRSSFSSPCISVGTFIIRHSERRSSSTRSNSPTHTWRASPARSRPSTSLATSSSCSRSSSFSSCVSAFDSSTSSFCRCSRQTPGSTSLLLRRAQLLVHAQQLVGDALRHYFVTAFLDRLPNRSDARFVDHRCVVHGTLERRQLAGLVRDLDRRCSLGAFSRLRGGGPCIAFARYRLAGAVLHRAIAIATDL